MKTTKLLNEVNTVIHKLNIDFTSIQVNYETSPVLTYYTLLDMARYCQQFSQKLELAAVEYKKFQEEKND